jgi:hypothetical protein
MIIILERTKMKKRKKDEISHYIPGLSVGGRPLCDR